MNTMFVRLLMALRQYQQQNRNEQVKETLENFNSISMAMQFFPFRFILCHRYSSHSSLCAWFLSFFFHSAPKSVQIKLFHNITKHTTFPLSTLLEYFFTFTLSLHCLSRLTSKLCYIKQKLKFSHFLLLLLPLSLAHTTCPSYSFAILYMPLSWCMHSQKFLHLFCIFFSLTLLSVPSIDRTNGKRKKKFNETRWLCLFHHTWNHSLIIHFEHNARQHRQEWREQKDEAGKKISHRTNKNMMNFFLLHLCFLRLFLGR